MENTLSIDALEGYKALRQGIIDAVRQRQADEPKWMFENDQAIDLSELAKDRQSRQKSKNGHVSLNGSELVEKAFLGRVFELYESMDDDDYSSSQDNVWVKDQINVVVSNEMSDQMDAFAEQHGLESHEVEEALKDDNELEAHTIFDYDLHHVVHSLEGSVPMQIKLDIEADLLPSICAASLLINLKIDPKAWIAAVVHAAEADPDNANQFVEKDGEAFDSEEFARRLGIHVATLSSRGFVFATDQSQALVDPAELIDKMQNSWNVEKTDLLLRFNLSSTHVDDVSMPVARTLDDHEINSTPIVLMGKVELMPNDNDDSGKGDGLILRHPFSCKLSDMSLASCGNSEADDRPEPTTCLAGAGGLLMRTYEILIEPTDCKGLLDFARQPRTESIGGSGFIIPVTVAKKLGELYVDADGFDAQRVSAKYPGLSQFLPAMNPPSPIEMGAKLLQLLSGSMLVNHHSPVVWRKSEVRERCAWLVRQGANLNLRLGEDNTGPQAVHLAASISDVDMVRSMHAHGADITTTYRPQMAGDGQDVGVWEAFVRRAVALRRLSPLEDISELVDALNWMGSLGGGQSAPCSGASGDKSVRSSTIVNVFNELTAVDQAMAIIDDASLSTTYLKDMKERNASFGAEQQLAQELLLGMIHNSMNFSRACMDAGARTNMQIGDKTVEQTARDRISNTSWTWSKNTAIDDAVAYCNALAAREAIESLDGLIVGLGSRNGHRGASSHASP